MAITLVSGAHTIAGSGSAPATSAINTTGGDALVSAGGVYAPAVPSMSVNTDSKGNVFTALTQQNTGDPGCRLFYKQNPAVGSGHTIDTSDSFRSISLAAFAGTNTSSLLDSGGSAGETGATASSQPVSTGSVTPNQANSLLVTASSMGGGSSNPDTITGGGGYTVLDHIPTSGGAEESLGFGYLIQTSAGASNPSWSSSGGGFSGAAACIAILKPAAGGGGNVISGAANDNADATSGSVKVAVKASGGATETKDASAGSLKVAVKVSGGATEGADASAGSVKVAVKISGGATETADASAGNVTATQGYHVSGNANEGADASSGSVKVAVHISGGTTEGSDASAGNVTATARTISGGATETADASAGSLHNANPLPLPVQQGMGPGWNLFHHQPARVREHDSVEDDIRRILAKAEEAKSPKAKRQAVKELRSVVGEAVAKADDSFKATAQTLERAMRLEMSADAFLRNVSNALEKQRIQDSDDMEAFMIIAELAA